jgi:hypothetical protein
LTSPETLYTKNVINKLRFLLVTHSTYFDTRFGCYRFLKSGYRAGQILGRLDIPVLDKVFGPQEAQKLPGFEHEFCSQYGQLSNAYSNTGFNSWSNGYSHLNTADMRSLAGR